MLKYKSIASYAPCMNNVDILFSAWLFYTQMYLIIFDLLIFFLF